jgi:hypothetical protein
MASTDTGVTGPTRARIGARTLRPDRWWLSPLVTFVVFTAFVVYATWRAFAGEHYYASPYLSPFYSPCMGQQCVEGSADFGRPFDWFPYSPALIILIVPLGFRMTCYYYRKAYYRAFWLSPPACAVAEPHGSYSGETRLPLVLQNLHRWFLILSALVAMVLTYDVVLAFRNAEHEWGHMGLGTVVLGVNAAFIWLYTLSCHSVRYRLWTWVSRMNVHHPRYAWLSLFSVALADLYVYLVASGRIDDVRFF